ncbi:MAG: nucleotidyltransferase family protein [Armatimonadetes bacterium]|nr:nucleotidyltransferase family protein [Armatimonadota bacterium]
MSFPAQVEATLLAGGPFTAPPGENAPRGKGLLQVGGLPMAARALRALVASPRIGRVILVSPVAEQELQDAEWEGVDAVVPAGDRLIDSFRVGLEQVTDRSQPAMVVAGDLPFLSAEAVTDYVERCEMREEFSVWYGYLRREISERIYPGIPHTWGQLREGVFCGAGLFMSRPQALDTVYAALTGLTLARKNPFRLASMLGWSPIFLYLVGQLSISRAENAMSRLLGVPCAGVETPYAETAFNVDDAYTLEHARRLAQDGGRA